MKKEQLELELRAAQKRIAELESAQSYFAVEGFKSNAGRGDEQAKDTRRMSEETFGKAFMTNPDPIVISDLASGLCKDVNESILRDTGYEREEIIGYTDLERNLWINPEDRARLAETIRTRGFVRNFETQYRRKTGEVRDILLSASIIEVEQDEKQLLTVMRDITESRLAEKKLRESEFKFRSLYEAMIEISAIHEIVYDGAGKAVDYRILDCNPAYEQILGIPRQRAVGALASQLYGTGEPPYFNIYLKVAQTGISTIFETEFARLEKAFIISAFSPQRDRFVTVATDITERKLAEKALRDSEEKFSKVFQSNPIGINIFRVADNRCIDVNDTFLNIIGYTREEMVGHSASELNLFVNPEERKAWMSELRQGRGVRHQNAKMRHRSGQIRDVLASLDLIVVANEPMVIVIAQDITERKQAEDRIRRQLDYLNALRVIDQTIASTFDLRLSLNALLAQTTSILSIDATAVLLFNPTDYTLEYSAGMGFQTDTITTAKIKLGEGLAGRVAMERRLIQVTDRAVEPNHPLFRVDLKDEGFVSYYGVPLIAKGKVIGVLELFHRSFVERDQEWLDFLYTLASQAAIAIDDAQLFENLQKSNLELRQAYDATIEGWSRALDLRDRETEGHTLRVVENTLALAHRMGLNETQMIQVHRGALLHDIGKLGVPDGILLKPGPLTTDEWVVMRKHPTFAFDMLSPVQYLSGALDIPYCHHEKWDGTGYPRGLKGVQIPLTARIFTVVDVYDALTSDRPYRSAWTREDALAYIRSLSGAQFDPDIVDAFIQTISDK